MAEQAKPTSMQCCHQQKCTIIKDGKTGIKSVVKASTATNGGKGTRVKNIIIVEFSKIMRFKMGFKRMQGGTTANVNR